MISGLRVPSTPRRRRVRSNFFPPQPSSTDCSTPRPSPRSRGLHDTGACLPPNHEQRRNRVRIGTGIGSAAGRPLLQACENRYNDTCRLAAVSLACQNQSNRRGYVAQDQDKSTRARVLTEALCRQGGFELTHRNTDYPHSFSSARPAPSNVGLKVAPNLRVQTQEPMARPALQAAPPTATAKTKPRQKPKLLPSFSTQRQQRRAAASARMEAEKKKQSERLWLLWRLLLVAIPVWMVLCSSPLFSRGPVDSSSLTSFRYDDDIHAALQSVLPRTPALDHWRVNQEKSRHQIPDMQRRSARQRFTRDRTSPHNNRRERRLQSQCHRILMVALNRFKEDVPFISFMKIKQSIPSEMDLSRSNSKSPTEVNATVGAKRIHGASMM